MDNNEHAPSFQSLPFDSEFAGPADWARLYRARGLQVVPAFSPGESKGPWKRPLLKDWRQYQHELVADEVFLPWYGPLGQYRQRANMGVICGSCSGGLFVVDLDIYKTPAALRWWLNLLELHNARLELETVEQRTGGGGLQKLFLAPPGWTPPTCKTILGVDIRGQGGFAMLAPSVHESGKAYEWLPGRSPDEIEILTAPSWLLDTIDALVREHGGGTTSGPHVRTADTQSAHDAFGHQVDGREQFMTELVWGSIVDWRRECPIKPSAVEQRLKAMEKYEVYERQVNPRLVDPQKTKTELLEAEGRGPDAFLAKWYAAMRRWDDKVLEASKQPGKSDNYRAGAQTFDYGDEFAKTQAPGTPPPATYELLSVKDIKGMADPLWLVDGLVVDQSMGFIYGPPGCLKTFLALDMALSLASAQKLWWNRGIQRGGAVVYISSEGQADLKFRIMAWEKQNGVRVDDCPFFLIRQSINFMEASDVMKLLATVQTVAAVTPIAAVFVDTVSRVLPGAEENLQKDMSLFVAACDAVRQTFLCTVFGLHHTNKSGGMRGSTVIPGAGDFIIEMVREPGAMTGSIVAVKIKAAEDGWEQAFRVEKVTLPGIVEHTSLALVPTAQPPKHEGGRGWPDLSVCRSILAAIDEQWMAGQPWCHASNSSRSAVENIMQKWNLKRPIVKDILGKWTAEKIIEEAERDTKNHIKGYRKLVGI